MDEKSKTNAWKKANPEKVREYRRRWAEKNKERLRESRKAWRAANPEKVREYERKWRAANPEKARAKPRAWSAANKDKVRETSRKWREANKERLREQARVRYAAKRATLGKIPRAVSAPPGPCTFCGNPKHYAKGLCRPCYTRNRRHGSPEPRNISGETAAQKFRRFYQVDGNCWVWTGCVIDGNPQLSNRSARRFAYEQVHGPQPARSHFAPTCGNRLCVNPEHIAVRSFASADERSRIVAAVQGMPRRDAARRMREAGMTLQEIGDVFGVTRERVRQLLAAPEVSEKQSRMAAEWETIIALMAAGKTYGEIAAAVGLPVHVVGSRIRKNGLRRSVRVEHRAV